MISPTTHIVRIAAISVLLLGLLSACDKPKPAAEQPPGSTTPQSAQTQVNPAGPLYFEARDSKPSYLVALKQAEGSSDLVLTIQPQGAYKINAAFPVSLKLEDGVVYDNKQFKVSEKEGSLSLTGKKPDAVKGLLKFGVCTAEHCETQQVQITTTPAAPQNKTSEVTL